MLYEKVYFDEKDPDAFLEVFVSELPKDFVRKAMLIIPGGAYMGTCGDREGEPIALAFLPKGYNAFVLNYSTGEGISFPKHLIQASKAVKYIRDNAKRLNVDPEKVIVSGFSAGGHLAACLGTMWDKKEIYDEIDMPFGYNKPDGMMLIYPVISAKHHVLSFKWLFGGQVPDEDMKYQGSPENFISENSSPAYIMHTSNDQIVDVKNSLALADALATKGIEFEMHIFPDGPHGVALGNEITKCGNEKWCNSAIATWVDSAAVWAENLFVE